MMTDNLQTKTSHIQYHTRTKGRPHLEQRDTFGGNSREFALPELAKFGS